MSLTRDTLLSALDNDFMDFGKHIIPNSIKTCPCNAYIFQGYWEDIGTIRAFFEANLNLTNPNPDYTFFDSTSPVYTHARLPAGQQDQRRHNQASHHLGWVQDRRCAHRARPSLASALTSARGSSIRNSIVMGADFYDVNMTQKERLGEVPYGIGKNLRHRAHHRGQERPASATAPPSRP